GSVLARNIAGTLNIHPSLQAAQCDRQINAFLSEHRRHYRRSSEDLQASEQVSSWVKVAYAWALQAATGQEPPSTDLDAIHMGLQAADTMFRPLLDASKSKAESLATRVQTLELQLQAHEAGRQELLRERQELQEERRVLHGERNILHSERGRLSQQVDTLRDK